MSPEAFIPKAQKLFAQGKTEKCLEILLENIKDKSLRYEILDLQRRYNTLTSKQVKGLINNEDASLELNQINNSIIFIIKQIEGGPVAQEASKVTPNSATSGSFTEKIPKWLIPGAGILLIIFLIFFLWPEQSAALCADQGGDRDQDQICAYDDCNDEDSTVGQKQQIGTLCDDKNDKTIEDKILSDGCTCAGVLSPCATMGGDEDGDGICRDEDCNDEDSNVGRKQIPGNPCDDKNSKSINDKWQDDGCTCAGTFLCADEGGDKDNDGICANQDCDDNNPNIGRKRVQGTQCDDNNPNTVNDVIGTDGCSCSGHVPPCANNGGDKDNDGICANQDCNDNNANIGIKRTPGTKCNDNDSNTRNDKIGTDGCTCAGTAPYTCHNKNFNVNANRINNTGINIKKGSIVNITASGSGIKFSFDLGSGYGPGGEARIANSMFPAPGENEFILLANIGSDFYPIGYGKEFTALREGELKFLFNDVKLDDNSGSVNVSVKVTCME